MEFRFTEEQDMMADVVANLLSAHCTPSDLRRLMDAGAARDQDRWNRITALGLASILVPENKGGLNLAPVDFVRLAQAAGYAALPEPLVESAGIALPLLADLVDQDDPVLQAALAEQITLALKHPANLFVADADTAGAVLVATTEGVLLCTPEEAGLVAQPSVDPFRRLATVAPTGGRPIAGPEAAARIEAAFDRGALFAAAQLLGIAQRCVDLAVGYAKERQQFGKPIGAYQAIKHHLATCQVKIEFARPVIWAAAEAAPRGDLMSRARISQAKLAATEAADLAARSAIQVHGAMGYSWEVDVHFFLKRALALTAWWGDPTFHRARVAARVFDGHLGPEFTFATEGQNA